MNYKNNLKFCEFITGFQPPTQTIAREYQSIPDDILASYPTNLSTEDSAIITYETMISENEKRFQRLEAIANAKLADMRIRAPGFRRGIMTPSKLSDLKIDKFERKISPLDQSDIKTGVQRDLSTLIDIQLYLELGYSQNGIDRAVNHYSEDVKILQFLSNFDTQVIKGIDADLVEKAIIKHPTNEVLLNDLLCKTLELSEMGFDKLLCADTLIAFQNDKTTTLTFLLQNPK